MVHHQTVCRRRRVSLRTSKHRPSPRVRPKLSNGYYVDPIQHLCIPARWLDWRGADAVAVLADRSTSHARSTGRRTPVPGWALGIRARVCVARAACGPERRVHPADVWVPRGRRRGETTLFFFRQPDTRGSRSLMLLCRHGYGLLHTQTTAQKFPPTSSQTPLREF